jgi:DMSO/TMAO reductase YedYZ molybdopterin-dependent catalytic subunit
MPTRPRSDRRSFLRTGLAAAGTLMLGGCQPLSEKPWVLNILSAGEWMNCRIQRLLLSASALAPEYAEADIAAVFKPNGTSDPTDAHYKALAKKNFADFRLTIDGLVERPANISMRELREMPARTQITRHDCVEGWSCIGKWKGVPLGDLLQRVGVKSQARFVVFHCADTMDEGEDDAAVYYESVDLADAFHPQTIMAYELNDKPLPVANGAPLRVRVERQLGYKMAKYVMRIELVESFDKIGKGRGGYWEDQGYDWYAGI